MAEVLIINGELVKDLVSLEEATLIVEHAFSNYYQGKSVVYPAVREIVDEHQGIFGVKSSYLINDEIIGLKAGGFWKNNVNKGKTNHQSTMVLFDPLTGEPVCLLDANYLTGIRTGAAGSIAAKYLARKNSKIVGMIGAGIQSKTQLEGILNHFQIERVIVYSQTQRSAKMFVDEIINRGINAQFADSPQYVAEISDILITTTPSFTPIIKTSWLKAGAHLNAMGSDTIGKREVEINVKPDKLVCDYWEQSSIMGEFQHGIKREEVYAEIGQITSSEKIGRENDHEITFFDSTGIAVQDLSVAAFIYQKAKETGLGVKVKL